MTHITSLGIDISKNVFELCGLDKQGKKIVKKTVKRLHFVNTVSKLSFDTIYMEACGGANHWHRVFSERGLTVKLISPQFVKPFVKTNKTDANDAEAIAEAGSRGQMRFVSAKTLEQQDIQSLLRIRERIKNNRTRLMNEIRGLLQEVGLTLSLGARNVYKELPALIENKSNQLTPIMERVFNQLYCELKNTDEEMSHYEKELAQLYKTNDNAQKLSAIPGVGILTALSIIALVGKGDQFENARHLSAYLGLVPRQSSSGGREKLLGISKRGNTFVRTLLIHGARAVMVHVDKKTDNRSEWIKRLKARCGYNRTAVAIANKNARIIWALLTKSKPFDNSQYCSVG